MRPALPFSTLILITATALPALADDDGYASLYAARSPINSSMIPAALDSPYSTMFIGVTKFDGEDFTTSRGDAIVADADPGAVLDDWVRCHDTIEGCVILKVRDGSQPEHPWYVLPQPGSYRTILLTDVPCVDPDADGDGLLEYTVDSSACYGGYLMLGLSETTYSSSTNTATAVPTYMSFQETNVFLVHNVPETLVATVGSGVDQVTWNYQVPSHSLAFAGDNATASAIGHDHLLRGFAAVGQQPYTLNSLVSPILDASRSLNPVSTVGIDPLTILTGSTCEAVRSSQHDELEGLVSSLFESNAEQIAGAMVSDFDIYAVAGVDLGASLALAPSVHYIPVDTQQRLGDYVAHVLRADRDHGLDDEYERCKNRLLLSPLPFPPLEDFGIDAAYETAEGEEGEPFTCTHYRVTFKDGMEVELAADLLDHLAGSFELTCSRWE